MPPRSVKSLHSPSPTFTPNTTSTLPPADIISAVEFDKSGEHLATGDRGGRVVLFERLRHSKTSLETMRGDERNRDAEKNDLNGQKKNPTRWSTGTSRAFSKSGDTARFTSDAGNCGGPITGDCSDRLR